VYKQSVHAVQVYKQSVHAVQVYKQSVHAVQVYKQSVYAVQVYKQSVHAVQVYKQSVYAVQVYTPQRDDSHKDNITQQLERKGNRNQRFSRKTVTHWGVKKRNTLLKKIEKRK